MNEAVLPSIRPTTPSPAPGVYADLGELTRLQFKARGFSFLPRQPVHSLLAGGMRHACAVAVLISMRFAVICLGTTYGRSIGKQRFGLVRHSCVFSLRSANA